MQDNKQCKLIKSMKMVFNMEKQRDIQDSYSDFYEIGRYDKAIIYAGETLKLYAYDIETLGIRAESYLNTEDYLLVPDDYSRYIEINGESYELYNSLGHAQYLDGNYEICLESFEKAEVLEDGYKAKCNIAISLTVLQRYDEAIAKYDELILLDEDNAELYKLKAYIW